jgi:hypothetical protein
VKVFLWCETWRKVFNWRLYKESVNWAVLDQAEREAPQEFRDANDVECHVEVIDDYIYVVMILN